MSYSLHHLCFDCTIRPRVLSIACLVVTSNRILLAYGSTAQTFIFLLHTESVFTTEVLPHISSIVVLLTPGLVFNCVTVSNLLPWNCWRYKLIFVTSKNGMILRILTRLTITTFSTTKPTDQQLRLLFALLTLSVFKCFTVRLTWRCLQGPAFLTPGRPGLY